MSRWNSDRSRYEHEEYDLYSCPYDGSYPTAWEDPIWEPNEVQHPDTGWYIHMSWNVNGKGTLYVDPDTVASQYYHTRVEDLTFEEIQSALETRHDMMLFAKRLRGQYDTLGDVQEALREEGFSVYDI